MSNQEDLAYDGSNEPPKRDLTARERDIMCRVINDILQVARKYDGEVVPIADFNCVADIGGARISSRHADRKAIG